MTPLRQLISEIHRRSVWQVLGIYFMGSWGALQVVESLTESAGLPDWVPPFALVLLVLGLPMVVATAFVQEGAPGLDRDPGEPEEELADDGRSKPASASTADEPRRGSRARGLFTWRNAVGGGVAAFMLLGIAVATYFAMRSAGVGPVASLAAQGVFEEGEPLVLADFSTNGDAGLARLVTEALRVDLVESSALTVVPESYVGEALQRMGRPDTSTVTPAVGREIARRDGFKAVLQGEVGSLGSGYVLTASLVEAQTGETLAAFREAVESDDGLLAAIDKLSERIREKSGESLRQIRAGESLETVTTASLPALEAYTEAIDLSRRGREAEAIALLESALELDPEFGMAWRKLGAMLGNVGAGRERQLEAARRAYELRHRMGEVERLLAEAYYFTNVEPQEERAIQAYEQILASAPDEPTALNNLAITIFDRDMDYAIELLQRAVDGPGATATAHTNLVQYYWSSRRDDEARALLELVRERYPGSLRGEILALDLDVAQGRFAEAHGGREELLQRTSLSAPQRYRQELQLAAEDAGRGRLAEGREHVQVILDLAEAEEEPAWAVDALTAWAFAEALLGSPVTARAYVSRAREHGPLWETDLSGWSIAAAIAALGFSGDPEDASRWLGEWEEAVPPPERTESQRTALTWTRWALGVGRGNSEAALEAIDVIQDDLLRCGDKRCWGWWDRGRALEVGGRLEEAVAMYRRNNEGLDASETRWFPPQYMDAVWRIARLSEELGDAETARAHYLELAERWADADDALQPRVREARARAAALEP